MCRLIAAWDPAGLTNAPSGRQQVKLHARVAMSPHQPTKGVL